MSKLVEELGTRYFLDKFNGAYFVYDTKLVYLYDTYGEDQFVVREAGDNTNHQVPMAFFEGYSVFKWPTLGYRRLSSNVIARLNRSGNGTSGMKINAIRKEFTPLSTYLINEGADVEDTGTTATMNSVFFPKYDTVEQLPALFEGDLGALVLSENVVIEASMRHDDEDVYDVLYRGNSIASVTPDRVIDATTTANRNFVRSLLNVQ